MTKTTRIFNTITLSIVIISAIGISGTFLSDYLVEINWFNDYTETRKDWDGTVYAYNVWGARHYWYNWSLALLIATSVARVIVKVESIYESK